MGAGDTFLRIQNLLIQTSHNTAGPYHNPDIAELGPALSQLAFKSIAENGKKTLSINILKFLNKFLLGNLLCVIGFIHNSLFSRG